MYDKCSNKSKNTRKNKNTLLFYLNEGVETLSYSNKIKD